MPLDPSIYGMYRPQQIETPQNALMRGLQMQGAQQENALMRMKMQAVQQQQAEQAQQRQRLEAFQQSLPSPQMQAAQQGLQGGGGPTRANAARMPAVDPSEQMRYDAMRAGALPIGDYLKPMMTGPESVNVGPGGALVDKRTGKLLYQAPFKETPQAPPAIVQLQQARDKMPVGSPERREIDAIIANQTRAPKYASGGGGAVPAVPAEKPAKPLPTSALKMQQESLDAIGIGSSINADLAAVQKQIDDKKVSFGPVSNLINTGRNLAGMSSEESRNFSTFKSTLERLRNESLRLNTGVQTDGDAQRAWNELFQNINDTDLVKQRLVEIQAINRRGSDLHRLRVESIRANYGAPSIDAGPYANQPAAVGAAQQPKAPSPGQGGGPQPGTVEGGFRFKGGNPADPKNWERV